MAKKWSVSFQDDEQWMAAIEVVAANTDEAIIEALKRIRKDGDRGEKLSPTLRNVEVDEA